MKCSTAALMVLALGLGSTIVACVGSSEASQACTECAALETRIVALEARMGDAEATLGALPTIEDAALADALIVAAPAAARAKAGAVEIEAGVLVGTLVGYVAPDGDASNAQATVGSSTSGYLFMVPGGQGADETVSVEGPIYFEGAGCTGQAWVAGSGSGAVVSTLGAAAGFAFRVHAGALNEQVDRPEQYWAVPKGSAQVAGAWLSKLTNVDDCQADVGSSPLMFPAVPNDPLVTGLPSGPFGGKVQLGAGG